MQGREKVDSSETTKPSFTSVTQSIKTSLRLVETFNLSHNLSESVQKRPRYGATRRSSRATSSAHVSAGSIYFLKSKTIKTIDYSPHALQERLSWDIP